MTALDIIYAYYVCKSVTRLYNVPNIMEKLVKRGILNTHRTYTYVCIYIILPKALLLLLPLRLEFNKYFEVNFLNLK